MKYLIYQLTRSKVIIIILQQSLRNEPNLSNLNEANQELIKIQFLQETHQNQDFKHAYSLVVIQIKKLNHITTQRQ